jgi:hypothetical protein
VVRANVACSQVLCAEGESFPAGGVGMGAARGHLYGVCAAADPPGDGGVDGTGAGWACKS